jgi:hypothetical protein
MRAIYRWIKGKHDELIIPEKKIERMSDVHKYVERKPHYLPCIDLLEGIIRNTIHNSIIELRKYQTDYIENNQYLRVYYLTNKMSEEEFKNQIQKNDKKVRKNNEITNVIQLSITAVTDIVYRIISDLKESPPNNHNLEKIMLEFAGIQTYCNELFADISFTYNCVQYCFEYNFELVAAYKKVEQK